MKIAIARRNSSLFMEPYLGSRDHMFALPDSCNIEKILEIIVSVIADEVMTVNGKSYREMEFLEYKYEEVPGDGRAITAIINLAFDLDHRYSSRRYGQVTIAYVCSIVNVEMGEVVQIRRWR